MKISLKWLNDYVDVKKFMAEPQELARILTGAGLEVEGFEDLSQRFNHVVVGHLIEVGRHPNADKLTLCQVDVGDGKTRQIVCGAKNHKQGDKVVVALPGAVLPGDFAIKLSKIRDVESQGMLCSESELGFKKESDGIVILPKDAKVGQAFAEYSGFADIVFEINVTPNRADCLSHIGLAREIATLTDLKMTLPKEASLKAAKEKTKDIVKVKLKDEELCTRYCGRAVTGVKVGPSPDWLKSRLESVGMNSINNIVDITNYVMMEFGQPLHAFDASQIKGGEIIIDKSKAGETFKSFDGTEIKLTGEELTIRDGERAVALAGIVGGLNSGVTDQTSTIFLEAAHFNSKGVRRTSRKFGIETDSGYRFSRGVDQTATLAAMNRAVALMVELAGGTAAADHYDLYPKPVVKKPIEVRHTILEQRLGYKVDVKDFENWMKRLHCDVKVKGAVAHVTAPSFRVDLEIEMDFVEEFARLNGYDKIGETLPALSTRPTTHDVRYLNEERIRDLLIHEGYFEARNYNFVSDKWQSGLIEQPAFKAVGLEIPGAKIPVQNPLSDETGVMRMSLLPGLLTNVLHNSRHGMSYGRIFETGYVFSKDGDAKYVEQQRVAVAAWGQRSSLWSKTDRPVVYDVKSAVEGVVRRLQGKVQWRKPADADVPSFIHPGRVATLFYEGKLIGFVGALHPEFKEQNKLREDAAVAELNLEALLRGQPRAPKVAKISKFPAVERDFAFLMPVSLAAADVVKEIEKLAAPLVQSVEVFDVFRGKGIPEGEQSVAIRMVLQDLNATLTDAQLTETSNKVLTGLQKKFPIKLRS